MHDQYARPAWWSGTFSSLRVRDYRLFFIGQLISVSGTWMQTVAQSFLVLDLTHSGSALGLATAARFVPVLLFGPLGGLVADRVNRRKLLAATQTAAGLLALAFGLLVSTGAIRMWTVYLLAVLLGFVNVVDNPVRQAFIFELVPSTQLSNAVTLNSVTANIARVFGAAFGGGIAAALGLTLCFELNAASFAAVLVTLFLMSGSVGRVTRVGRGRGQVRAGIRYVAGTSELLVPLLMTAVVGMLAWEFPVSLPLLAQSTFHRGVGTYATMTAIMGAGAVVGGLVSASRRTASAAALPVAAVGWGTAITVTALAPSLWVAYVVLVFVGYGSITFNAMAKTTLQLAAAPEMRGRVMALWGMAWLGSTPIGGPLIGWIAEVASPRWCLLAGGIPTIVAGALAWLVLGGRPRGSRPDTADLDVVDEDLVDDV